MKKMYEAKNKTKFLKSVNNPEWYEWLFDKTFSYEHRFSKDLFDFNKEELLEFLSDRKMVFSTLDSSKGFISMYINWAIQQDLKLVKKNAAMEVTKEELQKIAVNRSVLHVDTIYQIIRFPGVESNYPSLKNEQDRLLIYLLFLGIRGDRAKELINLKFEHVDFENKILKLSEIDSNRTDMRLDDFCLKLFEWAKDETEYDRYMDITNSNTSNIREGYDLLKSDFVFRKITSSKNIEDSKISYQGILRRLNVISRYVGEDLRMKDIEKAGMTYIGYKILEQGMELTVDNPVVIGAIFNRYGITDEFARGNIIRRLRKDIPATYGDKS